jgi:membrane protease YdiL (CAAX protease family)
VRLVWLLLAALLVLASASRALPVLLPLGVVGDAATLEAAAEERALELGWAIEPGSGLRRTELDVEPVTYFRWQTPDGRAHLMVDADGRALAWSGPGVTTRQRRVHQPAQTARTELGILVSTVAVVLTVLLGVVLLATGRGQAGRGRWHPRYGLVVGGTALVGVALCRALEVDRMLWGLSPGHSPAGVYLLELGLDALVWLPICVGTGLAAARMGRPGSWGQGALSGLLATAGLFAAGALAVGLLDGHDALLQPRHLLQQLYDSRLPWLSVVGYALFAVAVEETLFRRFFTGQLVLRTGSAVVAVVVPALCFGFIHASVEFLPPADPLLRGALMTGVGLVWGWLYLKRGLAAVVVSHLAADLVLLSWPLWGAAVSAS